MEKERRNPETSVRFACSGSAAMKREIAVWIDAGEETGGCEKNCSGDEWMGLMGRRHGSSEMAEGFGYIYVGAGE